jgi:hypothetical protein
MEDGLFDHPTIAKVLCHDTLEQLGRYSGIPDSLGIDHHDWPARANTQTRSLSTLDPMRPEQQAFTMKETRELGIKTPALMVIRAEPANTHEYVVGVWFHHRFKRHAN